MLNKVKKILPSTMNECGIIIPILSQGNLLVEDSFQIFDAISKIKHHIQHYLNKKEGNIENITLYKQIANTYFEHVTEDTLYEKPCKDKIYPILFGISQSLPSNPEKATEESDELIKNLLSVISNRYCQDQHLFELRKLLIHKVLNLFEPPIRRIVADIFTRMEAQIYQCLHEWNHNIFRGFLDVETVHSVNYIYLLLDDLFGIAGNTLQSERDLLIQKNNLSLKICKAYFKNKLTVQHLYSEEGNNWKVQLAKYLSSTIHSHNHTLAVSIEDLLNSSHFLTFLKEKNVLSESDISQLKVAKNNKTEDVITINFPWLNYTDESMNEKTEYNTIFVDYLIEYIQTVLPHSTHRNNQLEVENNLSTIDSIEKKMMDHFLLSNEKKKRFTFTEIQIATASVEGLAHFQTVFMKPHLRFSTYMIANCDPKDAKEHFETLLKVNKSQKWTTDCLSMMIASNPDAALNLPLEELYDFKDEENNSPLHRILCIDSDAIIQLIIHSHKKNTEDSKFNDPKLLEIATIYKASTENRFKSLESWFDTADASKPQLIIKRSENKVIQLIALKSKRSLPYSIGHFLAAHNPKGFYKLINKIPECVYVMFYCMEPDGNTPFHILACHPSQDTCDTLYRLIKEGYLSVSELLKSKNRVGASPLNTLAEVHPTVLYKLIKEGYVSFEELDKHTQDFNISIFHILAYKHPSILLALVEEKLVSREELSLSKVIDGSTCFHHLSKHSGKTLYEMLKMGFVSEEFLSTLENNIGDTPFYKLARHNADILYILIKEGKVSMDLLLDNFLFHILVKYNPNIFMKLIREKYFPFEKLKYVQNKEIAPPFHNLSYWAPDMLFDLIKEKLLTLELMEELRAPDTENTVLHYMAIFCPGKLEALLETDVLPKKCLYTILNSESNTLLNFMVIYQPDFLVNCVKRSWVPIDELSKINNSSSPILQLAYLNPLSLIRLLKETSLTIDDLMRIKDNDQNTVFHILADKNEAILTELLLVTDLIIDDLYNLCNDNNYSPLHMLVEKNKFSTLNMFLTELEISKLTLSYYYRRYATIIKRKIHLQGTRPAS